MAQNLCASPLDAGTTVHGHGTNITFLNATMILTELRESVSGACNPFLVAAREADPPLGLDTAASTSLLIFGAAGCVLVAAFFVFRRSSEDRQMIKKLKDLDQRDLGIDNPMYDAAGMGKTTPVFTAPGYSSSESSEDDDATYAELSPSPDNRRSGRLKQSKGSKAMQRDANEDFFASLPAGTNPTDALEMMFEVKQTREAEESGYMEIGPCVAAGTESSRKQRRASKKAAKKAKKDGAGYFSAAFDSPLTALPNDGGYADVDAICDSDNDSRNDEEGYGYDQDDDGLYDDFDAVTDKDTDKDGDDGIYNEISGPAFDNADTITATATVRRANSMYVGKKPTVPDEEGSSSSSEDEWGGFAEGAAGSEDDEDDEDDGKQVLMEWG